MYCCVVEVSELSSSARMLNQLLDLIARLWMLASGVIGTEFLRFLQGVVACVM